MMGNFPTDLLRPYLNALKEEGIALIRLYERDNWACSGTHCGRENNYKRSVLIGCDDEGELAVYSGGGKVHLEINVLLMTPKEFIKFMRREGFIV